MATTLQGSSACVVDANVVIAIVSHEAGRETLASTELRRYGLLNYDIFAPGVIVAECLYALCQKHAKGIMTTSEFDVSVNELDALMADVLPPPNGASSLIQRAHAIGKGYGCSRSADGIYVALAEQLTLTMTTVILTFDHGVPLQAAAHAPNATARLL